MNSTRWYSVRALQPLSSVALGRKARVACASLLAGVLAAVAMPAAAYYVEISGQAGRLGEPEEQEFNVRLTNADPSVASHAEAIYAHPSDPRFSYSNRADSSADLTTGKVRIYLNGEGDRAIAVAGAELSDSVIFDVPGAETSALVDFVFHVDGNADYVSTFEGSETFRILNGRRGEYDYNYARGCDSRSLFPVAGVCAVGVIDDVLTATINVEEGVNYTVTAGFGKIVRGTGTLDLSSTGALSILMPAGVSFRSESGVLLTRTDDVAVPAPGLAMLFPLGLLALLIRRRRSTHVISSLRSTGRTNCTLPPSDA